MGRKHAVPNVVATKPNTSTPSAAAKRVAQDAQPHAKNEAKPTGGLFKNLPQTGSSSSSSSSDDDRDDDEEMSAVSSEFDDEEQVIDSDDSSDALLDEENESGSADSDDDEEGGDESDDDDNDDNEGLDFGGGGGESDDEGMEDGEYETAQVDFDVNAMTADDVEKSFHLIDSWVPDHANEVDRDMLAEALVDSPHTSIVQMGADDDDDNVVGLVSLLDIARGKRSNKALAALEHLLQAPLTTVHDGMSVKAILTTSKLPAASGSASGIGGGKRAAPALTELSKTAVLVNERVKNLPVELMSRLLAHTFETFDSDIKMTLAKLKAREELTADDVEVACEEQYMVLVLAKVQRSKEALDDAKPSKEKKGAVAANDEQPAAKQKRKEKFDVADFVFWREEDEVLYKHRDPRVAVTAFRCRAQYDKQPESEVPLTLVFACARAGVAAAIKDLQALETIQPVVA